MQCSGPRGRDEMRKTGGKSVKSKGHRTSRRRNVPKTTRHRSPANTREKNDSRRRRERDEALEQLEATSEVLQVISSSSAGLERVFNAMLANATRICGAKFGLLYRREGDVLRTVAMHSAPRAYAKERQRDPIVRAAPGTALGRALATKQPVQIADISNAPQYLNAPAGYTGAQFARLSGARTSLGVPMLKDNELVGAITIYRKEVQPLPTSRLSW